MRAVPLATLMLCISTLAGNVEAQGRREGPVELTDARRIRVAESLQRSSVMVTVGTGGGSGFVVSDEGWVVTNAHVVGPASERGAAISLRFAGGETRPARVLALDPRNDLAILAPSARDGLEFVPLPLGDPATLRVGQTVLAYGNPYGLEGTLTQGIVSARRDMPARYGGRVEGVIQTDAAVNPGNSGGPLVDARGRVVGVNTAILSRSGGSQGIGFAVPTTYVVSLLERAREGLRASEAEIGEVLVQDAEGAREGDEAPTPSAEGDGPGSVWLGVVAENVVIGGVRGVRLRSVMPGGPAASAGLRGLLDSPPIDAQRLGVPWTGHVILAVGDAETPTVDALRTAVEHYEAGQSAELVLTMGDGRLRGRVAVELAATPASRRAPNP